jgi:hypothetical protein
VAFIAGRGEIDEEIKLLELVGRKESAVLSPTGGSVNGKTTEAFCLTLQGQQLNLSALLKEKKFRHRGHKEGALQAMRNLMDDDMGKLEESSAKGSVRVSYD